MSTAPLLPPAAVAVTIPAGPRKSWRGGLFDCFGDCSASDFGSCCLVTWVPFIAFGQNMRKAFGLTFIKQCFLVLGCLYGAQFFTGLLSAINCGPPPVAVGPMGGVASSDVDSTDVNASKQYDTCMVKWNVLYCLYIPLTLGFLVYAGYRRNQLRKRFAIPGDEWEDYFVWLCCGPCSLCQETRTLSANGVEDGVWPSFGGNKFEGAYEKSPLMSASPTYTTPPPAVVAPAAAAPAAAAEGDKQV